MRQQDIIAAIVERLKLIDGNDPYVTDIAGRVRDSETNWDEKEGAGISVFEQPAETEPSPNSHRKVIHILPVQIKAFLVSGETSENARQIIADIKRAILGDGTQKNDWLYERFPDDSGVGLTMETRPKRHGIEYAADSFEVVGAIVEIEIIFITPKWEI